MGNDFEPGDAFITAEFDNMALFNFYHCDAFCPMEGLLAV
jgi:hypothetical protein